MWREAKLRKTDLRMGMEAVCQEHSARAHLMPLSLYLSNRLERFLDPLKKEIQNPELPWNTRHLLVVPSPALKHWIEERLCEELGIVLGLECCMLDELPDRLGISGKRSPLPIELGVQLEASLQKMYPTMEWHPRHRLACGLGLLFGQYAVFGKRLLHKWQEPTEDWQASLWREMFGESGSWMSTIERLQQPLPPLHHICVHVVGQSSPPPVYVDFLRSLSQHCPVHVYHLTPSSGWFGDLQSGKELAGLRRGWEKQRLAISAMENLEELILHEQPLLADLGRLHRLTQLLWEEEWSSDHVLDLGGVEEPCSLLHTLQQDLFWLQEKGEELTCAPDRSLSLHLCSSTLVQIDALRKEILLFLKDHPDCRWSDLLITGPAIEEMRLLLESVLGGEGWPLRWVEGGPWTPIAQWLQLLLQLPLQRATASEVGTLLLHQVMRKVFDWQEEESRELESILHRLEIWWGWDDLHRVGWLQRELGIQLQPGADERLGTWQQRVEMHLRGYLTEAGHSFCNPSQLQMLGEALYTLSHLQTFCQERVAEPTLTMHHLAECLLALCSSLGIETAWHEDPCLKVLRGVVSNQSLAEHPLSYQSAASWLKGTLQVTEPTPRSEGIWVGGLAAVRGIPARAIWILGMDEESFPSPWYPEPLNRLEGTDLFPSRGEYDRLCLLESLLGARDRLAIFVGCRSDLLLQRGPSATVQRLFDYIEHTYGLEEGALVYKHTERVKQDPPAHVHTPKIHADPSLPPPPQIGLRALSRALKRPLKSFLRHQLQWRDPPDPLIEPESLRPHERLQGLLTHESKEKFPIRGRFLEWELEHLNEWRKVLPPQGDYAWARLGPPSSKGPEAPHRLFSGLPIAWSQGTTEIMGDLGWVEGSSLLLPSESTSDALIGVLPHLLVWQSVQPQASILCLQDGRRLDLRHPHPQEGLRLLLEWGWLVQQQQLPLQQSDLRALVLQDDLMQEMLLTLFESGLSCSWTVEGFSSEHQGLAHGLLETLKQLLKGGSHAGT